MAQVSPNNPHKIYVLAVDDEDEIRELFEAQLPALGYEVKCAATSQEARDLLAQRIPDIILMDIMMPDTDGITLTREIHSNPATQHVPILMVSGLSDAASLNDAFLFGAADYLVKPISLDVLKLKLEGALTLAERRKSR